MIVEERNIDFYIDAFWKMKRAIMKGVKAPHKPLLLLAIMQMVEDGDITSNRIELSDKLVARFKAMWMRWVDDGSQNESVMLCEGLELEVSRRYPFKCSIENPFYYMQFEPFWTLTKSERYEKRYTYTLKGVRTCFLYAVIDEPLFELMQNASSREILRNALLDVLNE